MAHNICEYMSDVEILDLVSRTSANLKSAMRMIDKLPSEVWELLPSNFSGLEYTVSEIDKLQEIIEGKCTDE